MYWGGGWRLVRYQGPKDPDKRVHAVEIMAHHDYSVTCHRELLRPLTIGFEGDGDREEEEEEAEVVVEEEEEGEREEEERERRKRRKRRWRRSQTVLLKMTNQRSKRKISWAKLLWSLWAKILWMT